MTKKRWTVFIVSLLIVAVGVGYIVYYFTNKNAEDKTYREIQKAVTVQRPEPAEPDEPYVSPIDFDALHEVNQDVYAWIDITGTEIQYPILQHRYDDKYYLDHTIDGYEGYPGSIYTKSVNSKDFTDFNTVIYGHNMEWGSMFGTLKNYRDEDYLNSHREIKIYLPDKELTYQVFAAVVYDDRLITEEYNNKDTYERQQYLDSIFGNRDINSHILSDINVSTDDRIITLSTCIYGQPENRYLVVAKLVGDTSYKADPIDIESTDQ
ncbi:MAG: class B sortase [Firmicutes bacterium]|nr:class B sortase [Bacillota bacterium]